ncbi:putative mediator of RNA polymerase II transcription subunit 12 isoform X1 [Calliphora vicina]|uniref:putative mediator of RNA polymerase II transcription subunit 12 isoform X1 n=1 Tax=Calliphora vicina TaxID=7373 RepID=UPI00325BB68B
MAQRNSSRIDRFAQMSKQEEIIAKKRQEILEKQRTAELAKAVAAAQTLAAKLKGVSNEETSSTDKLVNDEEEIKTEEDEEKKLDTTDAAATATKSSLSSLTGKTGKMYGSGFKRATVAAPSAEQPPAKVQNTFCNDGSFLENFKKILEKQQQQQPKPVVVIPEEAPAPSSTEEEPPSTSSATTTTATMEQTTSSAQQIDGMMAAQQQELHHHHQQQQHQQQQQQHQQLQLQQQQHQHQQRHQLQQHQHQQHHHQHHHQGAIPPPPPTPPSLPFQFNPALMAAQNLMLQQSMQGPNATQAPTMPPHTAAAFFTAAPQFVPPPPPPTTVAAAAAAAAAMLMPMQTVQVAPPPPPPPPQLPIALANLTPLYMIPAPEPMQLNAIPQPKEFDLNAIPKPQLNLEAIQIPVHNIQQQQQQEQFTNNTQQHEQQYQQEEQQQDLQQPLAQQNFEQNPENAQQQELAQHQSESPQPDDNFLEQDLQPQHQQSDEVVFSDNNPVDNTNCIQIPTSIENLIDLVADNGDAYEETLRGYKNQLHPALWFLSDKTSEQYHHYRQQIIDRRQEKLKEQQQKEKEELEMEKKTNPSAYKQRRLYCSIEEDKYDPESVISADNDSDDEYRRGMMDRNRDNIKRRIECRNELSEEERQEREAEEQEELRRMEKKKLRKSRWGGKIEMPESSSSSILFGQGVPSSFANQNKPLLSTVTRSDPALLSYAKLNYGSTNLTEEDWKKCEEHFKVNLLYQDMMRKRQEIDRLAKSGKFKYEYDSDEDVDGGTWEHKLRLAEMEATRIWASALTKQSEGKHHIGDFLPPEELKKFMEQYEAKKSNRMPDLSDYKEYKLKEDNIGFQMLQKLGWKEGQGLGQDGAGIVDPVNKGPQREGNQGLGVQNSATPEECDNEYDAYRKRMMLAYRFRPNPLNNPRRAYY